VIPADKACILRYAFGTTVCVALSMAFGWTLSALAPILAAAFLGNRGPRPDLRATLGILLAIVLIFGVGLLVTLLLYPYPVVFLLLFCTALYRTYYAAACGKPGFVILLYTMAILLLPLLGGNSAELAMTVAQGFMTSALVALLVVQIAHTLFPGESTPTAPATAADLANAGSSAWLSTAVVLPLALVCLVFNLTNMVLPLIMVATLSQKPDFSTGAAGGKAVVAANLAGGLAAVIFYQLLLICPSYPFAVTGFLAMGLLFGRQLFSGKPTAPLYGSAYSTVLILIGTGTGEFGGEADSKFYQRIFQISLAVCYVVGGLALLERMHIRERWLSAGRQLSSTLTRVSKLLPSTKETG
jgi:hypothetical protein